MNVSLNIPKSSAITADEVQRAMRDPVFFIEKFCFTFDPRPEAYPHHLPFKLYPYQVELIKSLVWHIENSEDVLIEKSRDMGVTWVVMCVLLWFWEFKPGFQALIGSRKEDLVDSKKSESLFGKLDYNLERLKLLPEGFSTDKNRTYMTLINPQGGNAVGGESANANFARQGRYTCVVMDEIAFWESPETAWTASGESTRCRIGITTPPKRPNFIKYLRFSGKVKVITLHWKLHPQKDAAWYERQKERKLPEEIAQELDINWEGAITGIVYPEVNHVRVGNFPYRPDWPLYVSHDPGHRPDPHALQWYQIDPITRRKRLVESFEANNKIAEWFLPMFGKPIDSEFSYTQEELDLIQEVSSWKRGIHYGDQYGRTTNEVTGTSVYDVFSDNGIIVQSNTLKNDLESRKTAAKWLLRDLDVNDTQNNRYFMECVKNARYPDLGENSNRITPNDKPIHDWTSHHRSCMEFFAVNLDPGKIVELEPPGATFFSVLSRIQSKDTSDEFIIES